MEKQRRKELVTEYKLQKTKGGIYRIVNQATGKSLVKAEINLEALRNRMNFSFQINSCPVLKLQEDWKKYGKDAFLFEILEEIEQGETEDLRGFKVRLADLEEKWKATHQPGGLY